MPPGLKKELMAKKTHMITANIFILNMARQGVSCGGGADFDWCWYHLAGDEHHLWYVGFPLSWTVCWRGADADKGRMVGSFTGYFSVDPSTTHEMFSNAIKTCA